MAAPGESDRYAFRWQMPFPATWRLTVQGKATCRSALFCEKESDYYDKKEAFVRKTEEIGADALLGTIYLYDRSPGTTLDMVTPVDLLRETLGVSRSQAALDIEGLTGYRTASRWTTWCDFGKTIHSLDYLFERGLEVEQKVYLSHLCDDLLPLVEGMDQRLNEYEQFARDVDLLRTMWKLFPPADSPLARALAERVKQLSALGEKRLKNREEVQPLCDQIKALATQESQRNSRAFERIRRDLTEIVSPREDLLRAYRRVAKDLRDDAARSCLTQAAMVAHADRMRALCQGVLRNRHYVEGDWRGESYEEPLDWLGPRPYEDRE